MKDDKWEENQELERDLSLLQPGADGGWKVKELRCLWHVMHRCVGCRSGFGMYTELALEFSFFFFNGHTCGTWKVPRLGIELELQLEAYAMAPATLVP